MGLLTINKPNKNLISSKLKKNTLQLFEVSIPTKKHIFLLLSIKIKASASSHDSIDDFLLTVEMFGHKFRAINERL